MSEAQDQAAVIEWAYYNRAKWNELDLLKGDMQGVRLNIGQAVKAKAQGGVKGWPDLQLPVARGGYHALFIEMKAGKNKCSPDQLFIHARLRGEGNHVVVAYGAGEAIAVITEYLEMRDE